jgi:hypothetical protein
MLDDSNIFSGLSTEGRVIDWILDNRQAVLNVIEVFG